MRRPFSIISSVIEVIHNLSSDSLQTPQSISRQSNAGTSIQYCITNATIFPIKGFRWHRDCVIAGAIDMIWGRRKTYEVFTGGGLPMFSYRINTPAMECGGDSRCPTRCQCCVQLPEHLRCSRPSAGGSESTPIRRATSEKHTSPLLMTWIRKRQGETAHYLTGHGAVLRPGKRRCSTLTSRLSSSETHPEKKGSPSSTNSINREFFSHETCKKEEKKKKNKRVGIGRGAFSGLERQRSSRRKVGLVARGISQRRRQERTALDMPGAVELEP